MASLSYQRWKKAVTAESAYSDDDGHYGVGDYGNADIYRVNPNRAPFFLWYVPSMQEEPTFKEGMGVLKGLTAQAEFSVNCNDSNAKEYIESQLTIWRASGIYQALDCLDYGFAGFEVMFREDDQGRPIFNRLLPRETGRVYPRTLRGNIVGCHFRNSYSKEISEKDLYLGCPKSFWAVHNRAIHPIDGRSHFVGAHLPFLEYRRDMGVADMRAVWTRKFSIPPVAIQYPRGNQMIDGQQISNFDLAALVAERYRATGIVLIEKPNAGSPSFEFTPISMSTDASGLFEAGEKLEDAMLRGIHVSPDIVRSNGTGSYNGREIPMIACLAHYTFIANDLTQQFCDQVIRPVAYAETGCEHFTIETVPLQDSLLKRGGDGAGDDKTMSAQPPTPGKNEPPPVLGNEDTDPNALPPA